MTCDAMLDLMLEADVEELEGAGSTPLAAHLRGCVKCRAVAQRLTLESELLAVSVRRAGVVDLAAFQARTRFPKRLMVGGGVVAVAASLALFVLAKNASRQQPEYAAMPSVMHEPVATPQGVAPPRSGSPGMGLSGIVIEESLPADLRRVAAIPVTVEPYRRPAGAASTPVLDAAADANVVAVAASPDTRVTIMRGRDSAVTVVWFSSGSRY